MRRFAITAVAACWVIFALRWFIGAACSARPQRRGFNGGNLAWAAGNAAAFAALARFGHRPRRLSAFAAAIGIPLTLTGLVVSLWARMALGRNWSKDAVLVEGQELVESGPYAYVRHPIYSGYLAMLYGSCLAVGSLETVSLGALHSLFLDRKARAEELLLAEQFGTAWEAFERSTWRFIPGLY